MLQPNGKPCTRSRFWDFWDEARKKIPELHGVTPHGLRATAVIRLRREGLSELQICDVIGMSPAMVKRYCRFADREGSVKAVLLSLERTRRERGL
jgi:integrase